MGSFNRTGFISHLPIKYGDEIVLFLMADTINKYQIPIGLNGTGYTPLCLPFIGRYDDCGSIENIESNFNSRYFNKKVGISIEEFLQKLYNCDGMSLNEMSDKITELENENFEGYKEDTLKYLIEKKNEKISFYHEMSEYYKRILNIKIEGEGKKDLEKFVELQKREFYDSSIVVTMELKAVYDKMIEIGEKNFYDGFWEKPKFTISEAFDNTNKIIQLVGKKNRDINPFTIGIYFTDLPDNKDLLGPTSWFSYYTLLGDTATCDTLDYRLYHGCCMDISEMKEDAIRYAYFVRMMHHMCIVFTLSPYHQQEISYDKIASIYQFMSDYISKEKEKYGSD